MLLFYFKNAFLINIRILSPTDFEELSAMSFSDLVSGKWCIMLISLLPGGLLFGSVVSQLRSGENEAASGRQGSGLVKH